MQKIKPSFAKNIKEITKYYGATEVGITTLDEYSYYSHFYRPWNYWDYYMRPWTQGPFDNQGYNVVYNSSRRTSNSVSWN